MTVESNQLNQINLADGEITPELVAVIAAAATVALQKRFAIRSIVPASGRAKKNSWSRQGRTAIFTSRNLQSGRAGVR